jgi:hypothetical protein
MVRFLFILIVTMLVEGCSMTANQNDKLFEKPLVLGTNKNKKLEETSGLAASVNFPGHLWAHNDSGHPPKIFLLDEQARTTKTFTLNGAKNRDWEDIAMGSGPTAGNFLYVGDIGDNVRRNKYKYIYRFSEPDENQNELIDRFDTLIIRLEDGIFDSEALLCDPQTKNIYLLSKQQKKSGVYEITFPFTADTLVAKRLFEIPRGSINGGDISRDGNEILLRNYDNIYYWKKTGDESIADLLKKDPIELYYEREPQGESVAWAQDGSGFYTLGENAKGERAKLYFYKRK